jgi:hypothetical protein
MRPQVSTRRWLLPMMAAALLWLQALGLWHQVVHGHGAQGGAAVASASEHDHHDDHAFAGHDEGDPQCRLFDQLAHADIAFASPAALPALAAQGGPGAATPAGRLAPQAAGFLARGPPVAA